jgi:FtsP/CotA-like multicopper oxidase with cupredoxin domain
MSSLDRRDFLKFSGLAAAATLAPLARSAAEPDFTLRIANGLVELSPPHIVSTTLYNGQFPGPLLRFKEGQRVSIDIRNDTDTPELFTGMVK